MTPPGIGVYALAFAAGAMSFLSPCVVPLVPVYVAYLSGGADKIAKDAGDDGETAKRKQRALLLNTLLFVLGISTTFFALGLAATSLGSFLSDYRDILSKVGGVLIIIFGVMQLGIFSKGELFNKEVHLPIDFQKLSMNPLTAFLFGVFFSFSWTPCVGPTLASIITLAGNAGTQAQGMLLIALYTLGLTIPFFLVALVTDRLLEFLKARRNALAVTVKVGGVALIIMGALLFSGAFAQMVGVTQPGGNQQATVAQQDGSSGSSPTETEDSREDRQSEDKAPDFKLTSLDGKTYQLSELEGKVVIVNFWATWCPPCKMELPEFNRLYQEYGENKKDVVMLLITDASDSGEKDPGGHVQSVLDSLGVSIPCLLDENQKALADYHVQAFPTTLVIGKDGEVIQRFVGVASNEQVQEAVAKGLE